MSDPFLRENIRVFVSVLWLESAINYTSWESTNRYSGQNLANRRNISISSFGKISELNTTDSTSNSLDRQKESKM